MTKRPHLLKSLVALVLGSTLSACGGGTAIADPKPADLDPADLFYSPRLGINLSEFQRTPSGLYVLDVEIGDGPIARRTSRVWIHYVGWLPDGTGFDASLGGDPFHLRLGGSEVIRGWNQGIVGMKRGGTRRLVIRPGLGYGSRGQGGVPPGATMIFELELVDVD